MSTPAKLRSPEAGKRKKPVSQDPEVREGSEMEEEEMEENEEGEEEGEEEEEMDMESMPPAMGKRRKGKCSKAAKDGETLDGSCGKCASGKCDCGPCKAKRGDAAPAQGLTAGWIREDLKCGNGAISQGEKCHKGPATRVQPEVASKGLFGRNFRQELKANKAARQQNNFQSWRTGNKLKKPRGMTEFYKQSKQYAQSEQFGNSKRLWEEEREINRSALQRNTLLAGGIAALGGVAALTLRKRRDGVYAKGFKVDYNQLAI